MRFGVREAVFFVLLLATPVAFYFMAFKPRNELTQQAREEIERKQAKLRQLEDATVDIADLGAEIDRLSEAVDVFEERLPEGRKIDLVLRQVTELAAGNGLTPTKVVAERIKPSARYSELPLTMEIVGDFDGFYGFLLELERLERITRMPDLELIKRDDEDAEVEATITLSIFFEGRDGDPAARG